MKSDIFIKDTCEFQCAKLYDDISRILQDIDNNVILQRELNSSEIYVIKRFLLKERGCLKGIITSRIQHEE